jgi:hypothetical protein
MKTEDVKLGMQVKIVESGITPIGTILTVKSKVGNENSDVFELDDGQTYYSWRFEPVEVGMKLKDCVVGMKVKFVNKNRRFYEMDDLLGQTGKISNVEKQRGSIYVVFDEGTVGTISGFQWFCLPEMFELVPPEFTIGDKVRVLYATYMFTEQDVGEVLTVESINNDVIYLSSTFGHRPEALELVENTITPEQSYVTKQAKWVADNYVTVGTKVKVIRSPETSDNYDSYWSVCHDKCISKVGTIREILPKGSPESNGPIEIDIPGEGYWHFPYFVLEVVHDDYATKQAAWLKVTGVHVGSKVRVVRSAKDQEDGWAHYQADGRDKAIGKIGTVTEIEPENFGLTVAVDGIWGSPWRYPFTVLETVTEVAPKQAVILFKRCDVKGVSCVEIVGFEGILKQEELPESYAGELPHFFMYKCGYSILHIFDGIKMQYGGNSTSDICLDIYLPKGFGNFFLPWSDRLFIGDIIPETTFNSIMKWLRRAGARLAAINKRERQKATHHEALPNCRCIAQLTQCGIEKIERTVI